MVAFGEVDAASGVGAPSPWTIDPAGDSDRSISGQARLQNSLATCCTRRLAERSG
jgi:hypothetical protein